MPLLCLGLFSCNNGGGDTPDPPTPPVEYSELPSRMIAYFGNVKTEYSYTYDKNNNMTNQTIKEYDEDGKLTNTYIEEWTYNDHNDPIYNKLTDDSGTINNIHTEYEYDEKGNITLMTSSGMSLRAMTTSKTIYQYDNLSRKTSEEHINSVMATFNEQYKYEYEYFPGDNAEFKKQLRYDYQDSEYKLILTTEQEIDEKGRVIKNTAYENEATKDVDYDYITTYQYDDYDCVLKIETIYGEDFTIYTKEVITSTYYKNNPNKPSSIKIESYQDDAIKRTDTSNYTYDADAHDRKKKIEGLLDTTPTSEEYFYEDE